MPGNISINQGKNYFTNSPRTENRGMWLLRSPESTVSIENLMKDSQESPSSRLIQAARQKISRWMDT